MPQLHTLRRHRAHRARYGRRPEYHGESYSGRAAVLLPGSEELALAGIMGCSRWRTTSTRRFTEEQRFVREQLQGFEQLLDDLERRSNERHVGPAIIHSLHVIFKTPLAELPPRSRHFVRLLQAKGIASSPATGVARTTALITRRPGLPAALARHAQGVACGGNSGTSNSNGVLDVVTVTCNALSVVASVVCNSASELV